MSVNKVILLGNVGKEPEIRYVEAGVAVARLTLATTDRAYTLPNGTQVPERTEWHTVVFWRRLAELVEKYVHKGDKIYVEGRIKTSSYADKDGKLRHMTEILAESLELLGQRPTQQTGTTPATIKPTSTVSNSTNDLPF